MSSDEEEFYGIGPTYLKSIDWDNDDHRRSIAASLVSGVYVLEQDRQEKRHDSKALAPPWWEYFNFRLVRLLIDDVDSSIFGAVFEYENTIQLDKKTPHYVVAFRGTLPKRRSFYRDIQLDLNIIKNKLDKTSRVDIALKVVKETVMLANIDDHITNSSVWLTGHSLGASIAMICGRTMAQTGISLESYLFNPPFFSTPLIKDENVKHRLRIVGSFVTAGLTLAMSSSTKHLDKSRANVDSDDNDDDDDCFVKLSSWIPNLFVHPHDHVCSEYIGYFEHQKVMEEMGMGAVRKLAAQRSFRGLVMTALGRKVDPALHLIPSACLTVNTCPGEGFRKAHSLQQWWRHDLSLRTETYLYR